MYVCVYECMYIYFFIQNIFRGSTAAVAFLLLIFNFLFLFIGNILDGGHPTQLWLGGFQQPMKMASVNLEDGIPASDTMDSSYPRSVT